MVERAGSLREIGPFRNEVMVCAVIDTVDYRRFGRMRIGGCGWVRFAFQRRGKKRRGCGMAAPPFRESDEY
jgi:hypothetical protein